jgi:hypothetical protein
MLMIVSLWMIVAVGCGSSEVRDRAEDCTQHEYLDPSTNRCTPCPPIQAPDCREGCGYRVGSDTRGCPVARCVSTCDLCDAGAYFSDEQTECVRCQNRPDCGQFECTGALRIEGSYRGVCPPTDQYSCGACDSIEQGCRADDDGQCVDAVPDTGM